MPPIAPTSSNDISAPPNSSDISLVRPSSSAISSVASISLTSMPSGVGPLAESVTPTSSIGEGSLGPTIKAEKKNMYATRQITKTTTVE